MRLIHRDYYSAFPDQKAIATQWAKENYQISAPYKDFRFNNNVKYHGVGNGALMRANACAVLRLQMWCLKPEERSAGKKIERYVVHAISKPFAAALDFHLNLGALVIKTSFFALTSIGKGIEKLFFPKHDVEYKRFAYYATKNIKYQSDATINSLWYAIYQVLARHPMNLLGAKRDLLFRTTSTFHWAFQGSSLSLDSARVNYLRKHCGWKASDEFLKTYCRPWASDKRFTVQEIPGWGVDVKLKHVHWKLSVIALSVLLFNPIPIPRPVMA